MKNITIYAAKTVITMNPANPSATHVAVQDCLILGAGTLEELAPWGDYTLDERFAEKVIIPGFVEAHAHVMEGATALMPYAGYFDRPLPDGSTAKGIRSYAELMTFFARTARLNDRPKAAADHERLRSYLL